MKKLKLFVMAMVAMVVAAVGVSAETDCSSKDAVAKVGDKCYAVLSKAVSAAKESEDKTVILLKEATLSDTTIKIKTGESLNIDLNGFGITASGSGKYAFNNEGTLTIKSSKKTSKDSLPVVFCLASDASCIRNKGTLTVENIAVQSGFVALKNEPDATMIVKNSAVTATMKSKVEEKVVVSGLGIQNYGNLTVENSTVSAKNGSSAISNNENATAKVTNSTLEAQAVKVAGTSALVGSAVLNTNETPVEITDSTLKGTIDGKVKTLGEITTIMENLQHMTSGTRVILAEDTVIKTGTLPVNSEVPEGITLVVPKNVKLSVEGQGALTVKGTLEGKVDAAVENETKGVYYGLLEIALAPVNVNDGDKVNVLKDIEETNYLTAAAKAAHAIVTNKNLTLNLNGHKVTTDLLNEENGVLVLVDEAGRAEFNGEIDNEGSLTIKSGYYTNVPTTEENATTILEGGTYPANQLKDFIFPEDQEVVENADGTLTLRYKEADFSKLDEAVTKAKELLNNKDKYTEETVSVLEEALKADNDSLRKLRANEQAKIDSVVKAINDAAAGLKEIPVSAPVESETNPPTGDNIISIIASGIASLALVAGGFVLVRKNKFN